jgi:hypothetical protein
MKAAYLDPQLIFQGYRQSMERSDRFVIFGKVGIQFLRLSQSSFREEFVDTVCLETIESA